MKCPHRNELIQLNRDDLPSDRSESLFDHLENCEPCATEFEQLAESTNSLGEHLAGIPQKDIQQARIEKSRFRRARKKVAKRRGIAGSAAPRETGSRESRYVLSPGQKLGKYEILSRLGSGGMGEVYEARHSLTEDRVAIKVILGRHQDNPVAYQKLREEMKTLAKVKHANLVRVQDADEEDGCLFLVMELLDGDTLHTLCAKRKIGSAVEIIDAMLGTCRGLEKLHAIPKIHLDIKPANVMRLNDGTIKVIDLGLAVDIVAGTQLSHVGAGTRGFMSPEQAQDTGRIDQRSDIYSTGRMLKYLLVKTPIDPASKRQLRAVKALNKLVKKMTQKTSWRRPKSITVVISRLEKIRQTLLRSRLKTAFYASAILVAASLVVSVFIANNKELATEMGLETLVELVEVPAWIASKTDSTVPPSHTSTGATPGTKSGLKTETAESTVKSSGDGQMAEIQQLFAELPQMIKVNVLGEPFEPVYDTDTGELVYTVELLPDTEAYREFLPRLTAALEAVAVKELPETVVRPLPIKYSPSNTGESVEGVFEIILGSQDDPRTGPNQGLVSMLTYWNQHHTSQKWRNFVIDFGEVQLRELRPHWIETIARMGPAVGTVDGPMQWNELQRANGPDLGMQVDVSFMDGNGNVIDLDRWDWKCDSYTEYSLSEHNNTSPKFGKLLSGVPNLMTVPLQAMNYSPNGQTRSVLRFGVWSLPSFYEKHNFSVSIAPLCMGLRSEFVSLMFRTNSTTTRRVRFSSDQMKALDDIKVSFSFQAKD